VGLCARQYLDKHGLRYNTAYHTKFPEGIRKLLGVPEAVTWPLIRWFHKHSGKVLTTTDSMVQQLREKGFTGEIVPWTRGVDREIFSPALRENTQCAKPMMVCVSRVSKEKNLEDFFNLEYPGTKIMVGDGPMRQVYEKQYPQVQFVGFRTGKSLAQYYANADVFVFPSKWETFGIVMIEAMACGTPVAAYPCQGPQDVIDQGITGYMNENLNVAVARALRLDRDIIAQASLRWSWASAWQIFRDNLVDIR
jgi:glycosyltransferase involved in cell wall biosynthesis